MRKSIVFVVAVVLPISACQTIQHATPSGRPEVVVRAPPDQVKSAFVTTVVNAGYMIKSDTPLMIVAERQTSHALAAALLSTRYDNRVMARLTATFIQSGHDTRALVDMALVSNSGSAFERPMQATNSQDSIRIQEALDAIRAGFEAGKKPDQIGAEAMPIMIANRR